MPETSQELIDWLRILTGGSFAIGVVVALLAVVYFRRSRRDTYWRFRRQAGERGLQLSLVALLVLGVSAALCTVTIAVTYVEEPSPPTPPQVVNTTPTLTQTKPLPTPSPQASPTSSPTQPAQPTDSPSSPTPTETQAADLPAGMAIEIQALDDVVSDDWEPVQAADVFPAGITRVYVFFQYQNVPQGMLWALTLLRDGEVVQQRSAAWGDTPESGSTLFFFGDSGGFSGGNYEVRLSAGAADTVLSSAEFRIE